MLDEARQRHAVRLRQLRHRPAAGGQRGEYAAACRVGQRGKNRVQSGRERVIERPADILNHKV